MGMRMTKPWRELTTSAIDALPAQLGVYEIADDGGQILRIGYAGGKETFGMRTALHRELASRAGASHFRHEFTHGYLTRWQELLMVYEADHGAMPPGNGEQTGKLGTLNPGKAT